MDKWQTILTFTFPQEAYIAQGFLESEDIKTMLKDEKNGTSL